MEQSSSRLDLNHLVTFYWVAKSGSFTKAAAVLRKPKSTMSQQIRSLESRLGTRLLQRTTRKLVLTEVGEIFFVHCERALEQTEEAERAARSYAAEPTGLLRVGLPATFARVFLAPVLPAFCRKYPQIKLEFLIPSRRMDPIENLLDLVIRIGRVEDSSYIVRRLGSLRRRLYAAPGYVKRHSVPVQPQDLTEHTLIATGRDPEGAQWKLQHQDGREVVVRFDPYIAVPDPVLAHDLTCSELGIASLPEFVTREGPRLVPVLEEWRPSPVEVVALYPAREFVPLKMKVFLQELEANLRF